MLAQSALSVGPATSDRPIGWPILLPLGCLVLIQIVLVVTGMAPVLDGALADPDAYMRLNRVLELHEGGEWFDARTMRVSPPEGHLQHWTRPLDAMLLAGGLLLEPWLGFRAGLHLWGVLFSPMVLALAVVALNWASAPLLDRDGRLFACLALLLQPTVLSYSAPGRADHHALLLLLFILLLGLTLRLLLAPDARQHARTAGLVAALAVWISPEALTFIFPSLAALGILWLVDGQRFTGANRRYATWFVLGLAGALVIERGAAALYAIEPDRLSLLHVIPLGLVVAFWTITGPAHKHRSALTAGIVGRTVWAAAGLTIVATVTLLLFPELRQGPLGPVDPLYASLRLARIVEIQPLIVLDGWSADAIGQALGRLIGVLGIALPALPFLILRLMRTSPPSRHLWLAAGLAAAVFVPLAFYQVRWAGYAQTVLVLPYAAFLVWLLQRVTREAPAQTGLLLRPLLLVGGLFWPLGLAQALPQQNIVTAEEACPIGRLAGALTEAGGGASRTVMTFTDYGPELLYRTPHRVLSIPNHRPQRGFEATYRALTATDDRSARRHLARHGVDWILICPNPVERDLFDPDDAEPAPLYRRLSEGSPPPWLQPLPLPADLADHARLYAVTPLPATGPASATGLEERR